ncbi:hypothetical protein [Actinophytocola glycyrrhizae]|uniref:Uncharacterized protein n=1 Tax=Actinophytocola glycyrrhizae TaxID=2044873 RepID=A0ABV9RXN4_9PSEU
MLLLVLLLALTACGVRPTVPIEGGPAPTEEITVGTVLYLLEGTTLTRVVRPQPRANALELLAAGPTRDERAEGLTTEIPSSAAPITAVMSTTGITVRISSGLKDLSPLGQSQLVCTAVPPARIPMTEVILTDPTVTLPPQRCPFTA